MDSNAGKENPFLLFDEPERFSPETTAALRPSTDIQGLYLTGQDVALAGFGGALMGGLLCSSAVLNRNLVNDLVQLMKTCKQSEKKTQKQE